MVAWVTDCQGELWSRCCHVARGQGSGSDFCPEDQTQTDGGEERPCSRKGRAGRFRLGAWHPLPCRGAARSKQMQSLAGPGRVGVLPFGLRSLV